MFSRPTDLEYVDRNKYVNIPLAQLDFTETIVKYGNSSTMLIAEHLERFKTWLSPIIVYKGKIIKGGLRCFCLRESGYKSASVIPLEDYIKDGQAFNYTIVKQFLNSNYGAIHTLCIKAGAAPFYRPVVYGMNGSTAGAVQTLLFNIRKQITEDYNHGD